MNDNTQSITLDNFEQIIDSRILERGFEYYKNDAILSIEQIDKGIWEAVISGNDQYETAIHLQNKIIIHNTCSCPYDLSAYCKHKNSILKKFFTLFLILFFVPLTAQKNNVSDLQKQLSLASSDTVQIDIYLQLIDAYAPINLDSSIHYYEEAIDIAKKINDSKRISATESHLVSILMDKGEYIMAKHYIDQGLKLGHQLNDDIIICRSLISIALWNWELSNLKKTSDYLNEALIYSEKTRDLELKARIFNIYALLYKEMEEFEKEYDYTIQYYEISKQINDTLGQAIALNNLGYSNILQ